MNYIDLAIGIVLTIGLVRGFMKGFIVEVASLLALLLGLYGAYKFSGFVAGYLENRFSWSYEHLKLIAFILTFILIAVAINLLGKALTKVAETVALGIFNKLLGAFFGGLKWLLVLSVCFFVFELFVDKTAFNSSKRVRESRLYPIVKRIAPAIYGVWEEGHQSVEDEPNPENKQTF